MNFLYLKYLALNATSWALTTSDDILVGGQAVIEGVMMRSPKGYSVAVRRADGSVGIIKDVERLKLLYELFAETLDQLCRIGAAYKESPNVAI